MPYSPPITGLEKAEPVTGFAYSYVALLSRHAIVLPSLVIATMFPCSLPFIHTVIL